MSSELTGLLGSLDMTTTRFVTVASSMEESTMFELGKREELAYQTCELSHELRLAKLDEERAAKIARHSHRSRLHTHGVGKKKTKKRAAASRSSSKQHFEAEEFEAEVVEASTSIFASLSMQ